MASKMTSVWQLSICSVVVCFLLLAGCARDTRRQQAIATWKSPRSTPEELLRAVEVLVPVGSTRTEAEKLLGVQATWKHWHGPTFVAYHKTNGNVIVEQIGDHDYWTLEYPVSGGSLALLFERQGGTNTDAEFRFVRAQLQTPLTPGPTDATNLTR